MTKKQAKKIVTREYVRQEVKRLGPTVKESSDDFLVATILLRALRVGPNADKIAKFLKVRRDTVRDWCRKATKGGIFKHGKIYHSGWGDDGAVGFWLDCCIVRGLIERR